MPRPQYCQLARHKPTTGYDLALSELDGVSHVEVSLNPGRASVTVEPGAVSAAQIQATLDDLGFVAEARLFS